LFCHPLVPCLHQGSINGKGCLASWRKPLRDSLEDLLGIGPFAAVELGEDHLVVEGDLVGRPPPAFQLDADVAREPVGDRLPETSGLGEVVSNGAVLDRDHADSVVWGRDELTSPGVAAPSPGGRARARCGGGQGEQEVRPGDGDFDARSTRCVVTLSL
jgi:hypothetical protein